MESRLLGNTTTTLLSRLAKNRYVNHLLTAGTAGLDEEKSRPIVNINTLALLTGVMVFLFGGLFYCLYPTSRIGIPVIIEGSAFLSLILLNHYHLHNQANKGMYVIHAFSASYFGPTLAEGLPREWVIVFLIVFLIGAALLVYKRQEERIFCFVMTFLTFFLYQANDHYQLITPLHFDPEVRWIVALGCQGGMLVLISYVIFNYMRQNDRTMLEKDNLLQEKDQLLKEKEQLVLALEKADYYRTQFLLETSHELRVPLNTSMGNAQLLSFRKQQFRNLEEHEEIVSEINQVYAANYLSKEIINNILDLAKIESGKMDIHKETLDLKEVIEHSIGMLVIIANLRKVTIHLDFDESLPLIMGDRIVMIKIINNLLSNAIKFAQKGSYVELNTTLEDKQIVFRIKNTSKLSRERAAKIFEPFDSQRNNFIEGTGLGLTITRRLVTDLLKGHIWVETDEVASTTFLFSIPFEPNTSKVVTKVKEDDLGYTKYDFSGKKVMLVEDNEMNLLLLSKFIAQMGAQATCHDNVAEALEAIWREKPDIVISDNQMPGLGGKDLLQRLKNAADLRGIPVIILSGNTSKEDTDQLLKAGASAYVLKPVLYKDLQKIMYRCLCDIPHFGIID